jgi:hydroxymethylpyrimidine/phosphomethylpyrimidine kinase
MSGDRRPSGHDRCGGIPNVLTIAGTDPSGGAGIQADIKAFSALGAYGTSVITALVAQNTRGVHAVRQVTAGFVTTQIDVLLADVRIDAVKIGMLGSAETVRAVGAALRRYAPRYVVVDPVMVAKSGDRLLPADAVAALREEVLPHADLITPNVPEAAALLGEHEARDEADMAAQLGRLGELCPGVLLKGGHLAGPQSVDLLLVDGSVTRLSAERIATRNTHGTGCTCLRPSPPCGRNDPTGSAPSRTRRTT